MKGEENMKIKKSDSAIVRKIVTNPFFIVPAILLMSTLVVFAIKAIVIILLALALGTTVAIPSLVWWLLFIIIAIERIYRCWRLVPSQPPHVGLVTFWGRRHKKVLREGWHLLAPFFPFLYSVVKIGIEKRNVDVTFSDIRTIAREEIGDGATEQNGNGKPKAGGELKISVSYTYQPEHKSKNAGENLINFIDSGKDKGVQDIIRDQIAEKLREMAHNHSWEEITFSTGDLKESIIKRLTGQELESIEKEMNTNGVRDVHSLGILICRFNIGRIKEQGKLAEAAEALATERQRVKGLKPGLTFLKEEVKDLVGLKVPASEALDAVQVHMGKAKKEIRTYRGLDKGTEVMGMAAARLFGEGKTSQTQKKEKK